MKRRVAPPVIASTLVDTHCHLDMTDYDADLPAVLDRARAAGVGTLITIGIDLASSRRAVALAGAHEQVYATVGIHPHHVGEAGAGEIEALRELARTPRVVAVGEIGLDYVRGRVAPEVQQQWLERQVALAKELELPIVIHDREAHADVMAILTRQAPFAAGGVMHCFSGDIKLAEAARALGFVISVPGVVTFNKADILHEVVRQTPLADLLLETDAPYLAPDPYRGKRNEPAFVAYTAQKVAELKGIGVDEVAQVTTANGRRLFRV